MNGNFRAGLALAVALVLSSIIASYAFLKAKRLDQSITVTGSSKKRIKSDLMIWRTSVTVEAPKLADAYAHLTADVNKVRDFLVAQGFAENNIVISAVAAIPRRRLSKAPSQKIQGYQEYQGYGEGGEVSSYELRQSLEIRSPEIDKLTKVSRNVTQLINQGILLESEAPEYLYTHLSEAKVELLAEAARDARERAQQIASSNGAKAGEMRSAQMGVLQVTAADSTQFSGEGMNDTTSLEKDLTAVVHATFAID